VISIVLRSSYILYPFNFETFNLSPPLPHPPSLPPYLASLSAAFLAASTLSSCFRFSSASFCALSLARTKGSISFQIEP